MLCVIPMLFKVNIKGSSQILIMGKTVYNYASFVLFQ